MAADATLALPSPRARTLTERNWLLAFGIVVGAALLFVALQAVERALGLTDRGERVVYHPVESSMRLIAIAHILLGTLFLATSRAMSKPWAWARLASLAAFGVGLCVLYHLGGGHDAALPKALFYAYFLSHEFRDQTFFYRANGDCPVPASDTKTTRDLLRVPVLLVAWLAALFVAGAGLRVGNPRRYTDALLGWAPDGLVPVLGFVPVAVVLVLHGLFLRHLARTYAGGWRGFFRLHRPVLLVYAGVLGVLLLDILISGRAYAIVTLHVTAWYVFTWRQLRSRPPPQPPPAPATWRWLRGTPRGFDVLHVGLVLVTLLAAGLWAWGFRNDPALGPFYVTLSRDAFPFWTIMHVTLSWMPR
jgi:hypothetical protein